MPASDSATTPSSILTIQVHSADNAADVLLAGCLITGQTDLLRDAVKPLIANHAVVYLDLGSLDRMDSTGLGCLAMLYMSAKKNGKRLELKNLNKRMRDLLKLTNLLSLFGTYDESGVNIG
jgi:anti-sigma B factor antagonist